MSDSHTPDLSTPCIKWDGARDKDGYGRKQVGKRWTLAHRMIFEKEIGPIPDGLQIDHLCRVRHCVNPLHMEPVTLAENVLRGTGPSAQNARKTHCKRGHPLYGENVMIGNDGRRFCRECGRQRWRAYRKRKIEDGTWTGT